MLTVYAVGTVFLTNVRMYSNQASDSGGAIYSPGSAITLQGCNFYLNQATNLGGAIFNRGQATVTNTVVASNSAASGGGIYNANTGSLGVTSGSQIYANNATSAGVEFGRGGGIASFGVLAMYDVYLGFNTSVNEGGGLYGSGVVNLTNVTIRSNEATSATRGKGGGIYMKAGILNLISGCTVSGNRATVPLGGNGICYGAITFIDARSPPNTIDDDVRQDPNE